ncbi:MAG: adenylyltransferase [Oscillospiraceae bacterium]|nr:adenylyltransferase [Oscillospiraceae bacterium]
MHKDLTAAFNKMIDILNTDTRCLGGWHFGSVARDMTDEYSDYDPVFLIKSKDFESFAEDIPKLMNDISDELLICWEEGFNNDKFKNFCCAIRVGGEIHQLDIFLVNDDYQDDFMCKLHCAGCTEKNIIFEKTGEVTSLLCKDNSITNQIPDATRAVETYLFHVIMIVKYFKRGDIFKIIKNMDILFHAHVDFLLSKYDTLNWGGWESKVKHCVPAEKQEHLKAYFTSADIASLKAALRKAIELFESDTAEICKAYPESKIHKIKAYFRDNLEEKCQ